MNFILKNKERLVSRQRKLNKPSGKRRAAKGQALIESTVGLIMITGLAVMLIMFGVNIYNVMNYKTRLELVATEAAKVYEGNTYFLGMKRADASKAPSIAGDIADALCSELGLPELSSPPTFEEKSTPDGSASYTVCTIQATMGLPYTQKIFPSFVNLTAKGVSTAGGMAVHPPAVVNFEAKSTTTGRKIGCQLPAYALFTDGNAPLGNCSPPGSIKMPYSYTGYAMGDNTVPMLENAQAGDAQTWQEVPNADSSQPPNKVRSIQ